MHSPLAPRPVPLALPRFHCLSWHGPQVAVGGPAAPAPRMQCGSGCWQRRRLPQGVEAAAERTWRRNSSRAGRTARGQGACPCGNTLLHHACGRRAKWYTYCRPASRAAACQRLFMLIACIIIVLWHVTVYVKGCLRARPTLLCMHACQPCSSSSTTLTHMLAWHAARGHAPPGPSFLAHWRVLYHPSTYSTSEWPTHAPCALMPRWHATRGGWISYQPTH